MAGKVGVCRPTGSRLGRRGLLFQGLSGLAHARLASSNPFRPPRVRAALHRLDLAFSVTALAHGLSKWLLREIVQASRRSPLVDTSEPGSSVVCRPAAKRGIGHVFLQTAVPTRKTGNSGKVPTKMDKATKVRESLMRPVVKLGIAAGGLTAEGAGEYRGVPHDRHFSASQVNISACRTWPNASVQSATTD